MLEWLKTILGENYSDEVDKKVSEQIGKDFVARSDFNSLNETKKKLDTDLKDRDKQLEDLKKVDPAELQKQIETLQEANKTAKAQHEAELKQIKLDSLLEGRLTQEHVVNSKAVRALLDMTKVSLDGENLVGLDEQLKALKESDKWAFAPAGPAGKGGLRQGGKPAPGGEDTSIGDEILGSLFGASE